MHNNMPLKTATHARGIPLKISQKTLAMTDTLPPPYSISFPNGKNVSDASLKHCLPIGMPMIVMLHRIPASTHEIPSHSPQTRNQIILPKQPIMYLLRLYIFYKYLHNYAFYIIHLLSIPCNLKKRRNHGYQFSEYPYGPSKYLHTAGAAYTHSEQFGDVFREGKIHCLWKPGTKALLRGVVAVSSRYSYTGCFYKTHSFRWL